MIAKVKAFKRHFVKFNIKYIFSKKNLRIPAGAYQEGRYWRHLSRVPLQRVYNRRKGKITNHYFFLKMSKFFAEDLPIHLIMTWCNKFIKCSAHLSRHSNNYYSMIIFNFILNILMILHATFFVIHCLLFGILSGNFQHTNCSVNVLPDREPVITIRVVFISKQILRSRALSEQVVVLKIMPYLVKLCYRTFHYHTHTFF